VTGGALISLNFKHLYVSASTPASDRLSGEGWKIALNSGWRPVPGKRSGDFLLSKE